MIGIPNQKGFIWMMRWQKHRIKYEDLFFMRFPDHSKMKQTDFDYFKIGIVFLCGKKIYNLGKLQIYGVIDPYIRPFMFTIKKKVSPIEKCIKDMSME